jgi:hypothetical protein
MTHDPFVSRWLDFAAPTLDEHARLNADPDGWGVLITDRPDIVRRVGCAGAMAVVLVVPRAVYPFDVGPVPAGTFPVLILAEGKAMAFASGPLLPWRSKGAA